ncbi:GTP cyclohydrolase II [Microbotryomycetes sp. JL201]|nr:GTP cyclohydrolase II [Microbotryomycetes sp. JL201]
MLHAQQQQHSFSPLDLTVLKMLTSDNAPSFGQQPRSKRQGQRRPHVDPLMVAAAASTGPDITRNHYLHEYYPHAHAYESCDRDSEPVAPAPAAPRYKSQQAPRTVRLAQQNAEHSLQDSRVRVSATDSRPASQPEPAPPPTSTSPSSRRRLSVNDPTAIKLLRNTGGLSPPTSPRSRPTPLPAAAAAAVSAPATTSSSGALAGAAGHPVSLPPLQIRCEVRTRIPTPHGHVFLYLYSNNHDGKEHLAFVADNAQMDEPNPTTNIAGPSDRPYLRSSSLDAAWRPDETEMERIVRGAYVGRLSATTVNAAPTSAPDAESSLQFLTAEPPLVRIHSECFTGETIGSQRCDCGEQLDEAFRLITTNKRGVIVYLRQEGRGIGLLEKMRAYNLQDLGHDTVTANLMLGHGADMRTYDIAGAILRDLRVNEIRLLTNNPDKIDQIEKEGVKVVERVAMVPRAWVPVTRVNGVKSSQKRRRRRARMSGSALLHQATEAVLAAQQSSLTASSDDDDSFDGDYDVDSQEGEFDDEDDDLSSEESDASLNLRRSGVGMIGAATTKSPELEKYLRTKIERMGHMLEAPSASDAAQHALKQSKKSKRPGAHRQRTLSEPHPLSSSVVSIAETETSSSIECGSNCEQCATGPETQSSGA